MQNKSIDSEDDHLVSTRFYSLLNLQLHQSKEIYLAFELSSHCVFTGSSRRSFAISSQSLYTDSSLGSYEHATINFLEKNPLNQLLPYVCYCMNTLTRCKFVEITYQQHTHIKTSIQRPAVGKMKLLIVLLTFFTWIFLSFCQGEYIVRVEKGIQHYSQQYRNILTCLLCMCSDYDILCISITKVPLQQATLFLPQYIYM